LTTALKFQLSISDCFLTASPIANNQRGVNSTLERMI
jgi:hypothetical protein